MNRFLIFALLSVCVCAELFKRQNGARRPDFNQRLGDIKGLNRHSKIQRDDHQARDASEGFYFFTAKLPCTYNITARTTWKNQEGNVSCDYMFARSGYSFVMTEQCSDGDYRTVLIRSDLKYAKNRKVYFPLVDVQVTDGSCSINDDDEPVSQLFIESTIGKYRDMLFDFPYIPYDKVNIETIDGAEYYVFSLGGDYYKFYVDENKFLRKYVNTFSSYNYERVCVFNYSFDEDLNKDLFKLDKNAFTCCTDDSFFNAPEELEPCWHPPIISDKDHNELFECNLTVEATVQIDNADAVPVKIHYGRVNGHGDILSQETSDYKQILRHDLYSEGYFPIFTGNNSVCSYSEGNGADFHILRDIIDGPYMTVGEDDEIAAFFYKEPVSCGKEKCTQYCVNSSKLVCITSKDSEPHDIVGFDFSTGFLYRYQEEEYFHEYDKYISVKYKKFSKISDPDFFKLDKKQYPGCQEEAYQTLDTSCEEVFLELKPLPCSFVLTINVTKASDDGVVSIKNITFAMNSNDIGIYQYQGDWIFVEAVRGDLASYPSSFPYVSASTRNSGFCRLGSTSSNASSYFKEDSRNLIYSYSHTYDRMKTMKINDAMYKVYINDEYQAVFVDENGFIAKIETYSESGNETSVYNFNFDNADMSIFKLDEVLPCQNVSDIDDFYEEPAKINCGSLATHDPSKTMCAFSIETTIEKYKEKLNYTFYFSYKDKEELPIIAMQDKNNGTKFVYRGDILIPSIIDQPVILFFSGLNNTCSYQRVMYTFFLNTVKTFFTPFLNEFSYAFEEEVTCGNDKCTRYCSNKFKSTCVTVLNSEPHHILKYESKTMNVTYGVPVEVDDMTVFTLNKAEYPGCDDHPEAYKKPKCSNSSSSSSSSSAYISESSVVLPPGIRAAAGAITFAVLFTFRY